MAEYRRTGNKAWAISLFCGQLERLAEQPDELRKYEVIRKAVEGIQAYADVLAHDVIADCKEAGLSLELAADLAGVDPTTGRAIWDAVG